MTAKLKLINVFCIDMAEEISANSLFCLFPRFQSFRLPSSVQDRSPPQGQNCLYKTIECAQRLMSGHFCAWNSPPKEQRSDLLPSSLTNTDATRWYLADNTCSDQPDHQRGRWRVGRESRLPTSPTCTFHWASPSSPYEMTWYSTHKAKRKKLKQRRNLGGCLSPFASILTNTSACTLWIQHCLGLDFLLKSNLGSRLSSQPRRLLTKYKS